MIRSLQIVTMTLLSSTLFSIVANAQSTQLTPCAKSSTTSSPENTSRPCQLDNQSRVVIEFRGLNALGTSDALMSFRERRLQLVREDATPSEKNINEAVKALKGMLADRGYMDASVVGLRIGDSNSVRFVVDEGMKYEINAMEFVGNKHFTAADLAAHLREYFTKLSTETVNGYDRELLDYSLRELSNYMRSQGYLQAHFGGPQIKVVGAGLKVTIPTTEGPLCRLGELKVDGIQSKSFEEVRSLLPIGKGDIANGEKIGKWLFEDVKRLYGEKGFIEYTAEPVPLFKNNPDTPEEEIVDLEVHIDEGRQFTLRSLTIEGENLTPKQMSEFFVLNVGDVFNERLLKESVARINKAGLFAPIDADRDFKFKTDEEEATVALVLNLRKKSTDDR